MVTIQEIKTQIENANALGIANLAKYSVGIPEGATTYEIMQSISKVESDDNFENLCETLIDQSGVLDSTEGTAIEKVEQLVDKVAYELKAFECVTNASQLFHQAASFPTKAVVNLPNATNIYQAFCRWNTAPIPIVEELTVKAPNINTSNKQQCMGQMFYLNNGVKKVVLYAPDESQYMESSFGYCGTLEEVVLNFSTKNIISYSGAFTNSQKLKKIVGALDFSSATNVNGFGQCNSLEEITFESDTLSLSISLANSGNLTSESIQSIIDGLATVEITQTLTLHANVKTTLTETQLATISSKNWNLA